MNQCTFSGRYTIVAKYNHQNAQLQFKPTLLTQIVEHINIFGKYSI